MILVTGATGLVGRDIVQLLSQQGFAARALIRNRQKVRDLPGITWVTGDLAKPETLPTAFEDTKTLFLVSSVGEDTVALQHNAIEAARNAGIDHIVKLSAFGASSHSNAPICLWHYQIEKEMQESGMDAAHPVVINTARKANCLFMVACLAVKATRSNYGPSGVKRIRPSS